MGGFGFPQREDVGYRVPAEAMFELRPLSTGEILDRTFGLYRRRFWLYVGLSAVTATVTTLSTFVQISMGVIGRAPQRTPDAAALMHLGLVTIGVSAATLLVHLLAYSITQAATVSAVEASYLGRETSIGAAFATVKGKWYRYILVALWQGWSIVWPMLVVILPAAFLAAVFARGGGRSGAAFVLVIMLLFLVPAFVVGFILYLRNSLGIVSCVSEKLPVRQSMKRSKFLVAGYKTRAFLLYLLMLVLGIAAGVAQSIFNLFLIRAHGPVRVGVEITTLLVTFVAGSLVQPVGAIAFVLFYFDQRVRKEGFDVEMLLEKVTGVAAPVREVESPFSAPLQAGSPLSASADSPFRRASDSPFSSGPLPGSGDVERHG